MPDDLPAPRTVTARQAAELTGLNERTIRRMIERGQLHATKAAPNRYLIDTRDLPPRRRSRTQELRELTEAITALRRDLDALRRRITLLEVTRPPEYPPAPARAESERVESEQVSSIRLPRARPPVDLLSASFSSERTAEAPNGPFTTVASAARYLARHGINPLTPKNWTWLRDDLAERATLDADTLLRQVRAHIAAVGRRGGALLLHTCDDVACACHRVLP